MKCINCSAELTNEKFCPYCGTKVENRNIKQQNRQGIDVVVFEKNGEYLMYYPNVIMTEYYGSVAECKDEARMLLDENFGDYSPLSEQKLLNDKYTKKLIKKGFNATIDFLDVNINKLKREYEDSLDSSCDDEDGIYFENADFHSKKNHTNTFNYGNVNYATSGVYAYIENKGLFFDGDIPGLSFCRVDMCDSYDECLRKLRNNYAEMRSRAFFKFPNQNLNMIKYEHPNAEIVKID